MSRHSTASMMLELLFSLKISQIFLNDYASFLGTLYEKSKNMQKKSALTTLASFPSPEKLTTELRTQAPDNSRAAGAAAEKSRAAGWRGSFQHTVVLLCNTATIFAKTQQRMPVVPNVLRIAENFECYFEFIT